MELERWNFNKRMGRWVRFALKIGFTNLKQNVCLELVIKVNTLMFKVFLITKLNYMKHFLVLFSLKIQKIFHITQHLHLFVSKKANLVELVNHNHWLSLELVNSKHHTRTQSIIFLQKIHQILNSVASNQILLVHDVIHQNITAVKSLQMINLDMF